MKRFLLILFFHFFIGVLFWGCFDCGSSQIIDSYDLLVGGEITRRTDTSIDTIKGGFSLAQYYEMQHFAAANPIDFGISTAYAWSCDPNYLNAIDDTKTELYFNKPFLLGNDSIPANVNLLQDLLVKEYISQSAFGELLDIYFTPSFFDAVMFSEGELSMRLETWTNDEIKIVSGVNVYMEL